MFVEKQSRQVQLCTKIPPSKNKRSCYGGKHSIMLFVQSMLVQVSVYLNTEEDAP